MPERIRDLRKKFKRCRIMRRDSQYFRNVGTIILTKRFHYKPKTSKKKYIYVDLKHTNETF